MGWIWIVVGLVLVVGGFVVWCICRVGAQSDHRLYEQAEVEQYDPHLCRPVSRDKVTEQVDTYQ